MTRHTLATLVAAGLVLVLGITVAAVSVPYVRESPGPTVDVLGTREGEPVVEVEGRRTFPTDGSLRLTTVLVTQPERAFNLLGALGGWFARDTAVLPYEAVYPDDTTAEDEQAESAAQMVNSQDTAVAAALAELGFDLPRFAEVSGITPDGPSDGELEPRDRIVSLEGDPVTDVRQVFRTVGRAEPGDTVTGEVRRGGRTRSFEVTTVAAPDDPDRAMLGILVGTGYDFPFDVRIGISDSIGGPSAGLIFSLAVYDTLTKGSLTGGADVAGTGTIAADGSVGPIGGIQQKISGAEATGAELFLVPPDNCGEALEADVDDSEIRLVRADTMSSAVKALETYRDDPDAELPRCTA
ncbi:PDZ domain-containing protein [Nocardioides sp. HDW12B]|uniref:YlbL family protein n=1 Tax=Nocardioides sp. HDW12B TaxID=2714939 RepID=UPI00140E2EA9|nr:PDZ domain-containing protein [Nocardioides sp. HDW12B]QIK67390.1 PDZ domain-containing protein [Nocardioides sp. HDW12B]